MEERPLLFRGGSNSGGSGSGGVTPATHLRSPRSGDTYNYTLSGKLWGVGTNVSYSFTDSLVAGYSQTNYSGVNVLIANYAYNLNLSNGQSIAVNLQFIDSSDASGNVINLAEIQNGALATYNLPIIDLPATWSNTLSLDQQTTTSSGVSEVFIFSVVGAENVSTPIGTFACWKVNSSENTSTSTNTNGTLWYAPEMGAAPIKMSATVTLVGSDGNTYTMTLNGVLSSTNVPIS
ncbi:Protein of unknown function (DUF3108) [Chthonomonas calidirosea]|uniref:Uncharacterized protein n=1 Tax=Chthonomonas calidirosea (strain DSM 23976 / ICMP 18418 / T49) TaxID=1303518 RepID=S0EZ21_CHTCT|nr:DUF3108 domain-containing protein [Chthonomonas calidirosea]CCW35912.1 Protein of unknown function (DUF3108) [Chthonomonas calidirosea T49]CEK18877.1 Protein of unknown function (DUF3108) [Chthonomonas calidirosea]